MADLAALSTQYPILLFPVRVQAKFIASASELRVRFYPDQLGISSFEPGLSEQEIKAGQAYWQQQDEAVPRPGRHSLASWRRLVATYGAPRAQWLVAQTTPTNLEALVKGTATQAQFSAPAAAGALLDEAPRSLVMPDYFTVTLYEQHATAADISDSLLQAQLLRDLNPPYSPAAFPEPTTEFLRPVKTVDGQPIPRPLPVSFGTSAAADTSANSAHPLTGLDDRIGWMVDYEQALAQGLAVTIPLTPAEYERGFARLVVLGVRAAPAANASAQATDLSGVLRAHAHTDGLALVAQGTPTNNTDSQESGYGSSEQFDAESTFDLLTQPMAYPTGAGDLAARGDGRRLSDALGLPPTELAAVSGALLTDGQEAITLNRVLWPATYGYFMEEMLRPLFAPADIEWVRAFFESYVLGRGPLPAFRVGNVPYGVLPTTRFSTWTAPASMGPQGPTLARTLRQLDVTWTERLNPQKSLYPPTDGAGAPLPTQAPDAANLLTVLGGEATSVEFYQRQMLGPDVIDTLAALARTQGSSIWPAEVAADGTRQQRSAGRYGVAGAPDNPLYAEFRRRFDPDNQLALPTLGFDTPRIFDQTFQSGYTKLTQSYADEPNAKRGLGVLLDAAPLSETNPVAPFPGLTSNYIQWLATADFDAIRRGDFSGLYPALGGELPADFTPPNSLFYGLLRQAVLRQYAALGARAQGLPAPAPEPPEFFNLLVQQPAQWQPLYELTPDGQPQYVALQKGTGSESAALTAYRRLVGQLGSLPTARLERLLAEHLDLGNHRLDAWKTGLAAYHLAELRQAAPTGVYCGAFGWLENLRPTDRSVAGPDGIREDPDNLGFIHAPAAHQAVTAAILRQGYKSRQFTTDPADPASNRLAVNLSSGRVREALAVLEGVRGGASLGALLGQHFERGLTQTPGRVGNRTYAFFLRFFRAQFPYAGEKTSLSQTDTDGAVAPEQLARQVVDGLALMRAAAVADYPYNVTGLPADAAFAAAVRREVAALQDTVDALGDITVSEGVYQATQGNADRAGAMLDSAAKGKFPVNPDVVQPPQGGKALLQRVLLHLPDADMPALAAWDSARTLRAQAEPGLNRWLATFFGDPRAITLPYKHQSGLVAAPGGGVVALGEIALSSLELQPIDMLFLLEADALRPGSALDSLLIQAAREVSGTANLLADGTVTVDYEGSGARALRRLLPLAGRLRKLLGGSRSARPADLASPSQAAAVSNPSATPTDAAGTLDVAEANARLDLVRDRLRNLAQELSSLLNSLDSGGGASLAAGPAGQLQSLLRKAVLAGVAEASAALRAPLPQLLAAAQAVPGALSARLAAAEQLSAAPPADLPANTADSLAETSRRLEETARALLGRDFRMVLLFTLTGAAAAYQDAVGREASLLTGQAGNPLLLSEWLEGLARVREPLDHLDKVMVLHELTWGAEAGYEPLTLRPAQLAAPPVGGAAEQWLGMSYPPEYEPAGDAVSLVQLRPAGYDPAGVQQRALWLDEWTEILPDATTTTAVAFHYDQPNSEPPQTLLLAVAPQAAAGATAPWTFADLLGTVNETLDLAKRRSVEPDALAFTHLATVLPALVAPVAQQAATFTYDFGQVRDASQYLQEPLLPD